GWRLSIGTSSCLCCIEVAERGCHRPSDEAHAILSRVEEGDVVTIRRELIADSRTEVGQRVPRLATQHDLARAKASGGNGHDWGLAPLHSGLTLTLNTLLPIADFVATTRQCFDHIDVSERL